MSITTQDVTRFTPGTPRTTGAVLLASDGQGRADTTARTARHAAEALGATLAVVGVVPPMPVQSLGDDLVAAAPALRAERIAECEGAIAARLAPVLGAPEAWSLDVREGRIGESIAQAAHDAQAALVVVGTGAHGLLDRIAGEEVAVSVVRHADVPVLVVPRTAVPATFRTAVVGMDFSAASVRAAECAARLLHAAGPGAALVLVHVRPPLPERSATSGADASAPGSALAHRVDRLRALLAPVAGPHVVMDARVVAGGIVEELTRVATEVHADLVAVGTHGPTWLERLLLGSSATTLVREATRTVLVAPMPEARERLRLELAVGGAVAASSAPEWGPVLDAFTGRNRGRPIRVECTLPMTRSFRLAVRDGRLGAVTWDPRARRVELVVDAPGSSGARLTHAIDEVTGVEIVADDAHHDRTLIVDAADALLVIDLLDAAPTG